MSSRTPGESKPNILVIWGDDIGITNLSCYSSGLMGYPTPNIDRLANEGMRFSDSYGEQSCTAGRASFITGQCGYRTGLTKVGMPSAPQGLQAADPTMAELLKPMGYATGQFGKNHLGDRNEHLPTVHGFDEFFGNLYHLNAEEEPEQPDYPSVKDFPNFRRQFGPRGVLHCYVTDTDDPTVDARFGRVGKQKIEDTGPLTRKRMETCDDEFCAAAKDFIKRQHAAGKPWFCWFNTTHMHFRTHTKPQSLGQSGRWQSPYHDTMIDHDKTVGEMLDLLDQLGIADNTIVMYSTDNGPHMNSWPDGAMTPFRNEKNSNWEGAFRVPLLLRWPGKIKAAAVSNQIVQHNDWLPTFLAAAGEPSIKEKLLAGHAAAGKTFKVHLDGYNLLPYLTGQVPKNRASRVHLLQRRRGPRRASLRQLESGLHGAARRGDTAHLGGAVCAAPGPEALQSENRPVRAGGHYLKHILRLVSRSCLHAGGGAGDRDPVRGDVQGIPATAEAGVVHDKPGHGEDRGSRWRRRTLSACGENVMDELRDDSGPAPGMALRFTAPGQSSPA